jgi:transposase
LPIDGHSFRRVEVLDGTPRRRRWSAAEKAAIVAESQAPGAQTSEIALRYGLHRDQLYDWRREFGTAAVGSAIAEADGQGADFIPVVADAGCGSAAIEIEIGSAIHKWVLRFVEPRRSAHDQPGPALVEGRHSGGRRSLSKRRGNPARRFDQWEPEAGDRLR